MLHKLRKRAQSEKGFTLIELLVVILIIGILAAIAIPSFIGQRTKATDTEAKTGAKTAQTAMETYFTDAQDYSGATVPKLVAIEPTLSDLGTRLTVTGATATGYTVKVVSKRATAVSFSIVRGPTGATTRTCTSTATRGGCPGTGTAAGVW